MNLNLIEADNINYLNNIENLPTDYWQLQKIIKFISSGSYSATLIGLAALKDFEITSSQFIVGIKNCNGFSSLLNLLNTNEEMCILGSLGLIEDLTKNVLGCILLSQSDGISSLLKLLTFKNDLIVSKTCSVLSNAVQYSRNQVTIRKLNGLTTLVQIANYKSENLVGEYAIKTLLFCCQDEQNAVVLSNLSIAFYDKLIHSRNTTILQYIVGVMSYCSQNKEFQTSVRKNGLLIKLIRFIDSQDMDLVENVIRTISNCAEEKESRQLIVSEKCLDKIVLLIGKLKNNDSVFIALTNLGENVEVAKSLCDMDIFNKILPFLDTVQEEQLSLVVALLYQLSKSHSGRQQIKSLDILSKTIGMLKTTNILLLEQITLFLGGCADDKELLKQLYDRDGVRYIWSLLKSKHQKLQAAAAKSIGPCISNISGGSDMIRSFVGGIELIVNLLKSENEDVLTNVCRAITNISSDQENLEVISDQGVIGLLSNLQHFNNEELKKQLCLTIASCSKSSRNRIQFKEQGLLDFVIACLSSKTVELQKYSAKALVELSNESNYYLYSRELSCYEETICNAFTG